MQHLVKLSDAGITYPRVVFRDEPLYLFGFLSAEATSLIAECLIEVVGGLLLRHVKPDPVG
jgi:hypothetical protein